MAQPESPGLAWSLLPFEPTGRMTRTHAALWGLILATTVADTILTLVGIERGLGEGNVVVRTMLAEFGLAGLWLVKFAAMCWLVVGWRLLSERNASIFLGLFALVTTAVAIYNATLVL